MAAYRSLHTHPVKQAPLGRAADRPVLLVYVLVFAGALLAEALSSGQCAARLPDPCRTLRFHQSLPFATVGTLIWVAIATNFIRR